MKQIQKPTNIDRIGLISLGILWSMAFISLRYLSAFITPEEIVFWRVFTATLTLAVVVKILGLKYKPNKQDNKLIISYAFWGTALPFIMLTYGSLTVTGGIMTLLASVAPFSALIMGHFFTKDDRITPYKLLGVVLGFIGVGFALWDGKINGTADIFGAALIIGTVILYQTSSHTMRKASHISALLFIYYSLIASTILLFVFTLATDKFSPIEYYYSNNIILILLFVGIFPTALAWWYRFVLTNKAGYGFVSTVAYIIPVSGVFLGHLFLGEQLSEYIFISLGLVLFAMWIFSKK